MKLKFQVIFIFLFTAIINYTKVNSQNEPQSESDKKILFEAQKFQYILETAYQNALDTFDIDKVSETAFNALLKDLDPFSTYFPPEKQKNLDDRTKGSQEGIGVDLATIGDTLVITSITHDSPSDSAGLKTGDKILFIGGENVARMQREDALRKLIGDKESKVSVIIKRGIGNLLQEFVLTRRDVLLSSIDADFLVPGTNIAYLKCNRISEISHDEFVRELTKLRKEGMKSLVLDIRGNAGGQLEQTCKIADEFISGERKITYTEARSPNFIYEYKSKNGDAFEDLPIVVIIDANSASGSEVIAGVIQDYDRGLVVGEQSFGKGLAQSQWKMNDGSGFRLTVAAYRTPSGRNIQKPYNNPEAPILDPSVRLNTNSEVVKNLQEMIKKNGGLTKMPIYYTSKGRTVVGGGGIFPDYYEKKDTTTLLTRVLQNKGIFAETALNYLFVNRANLEKKYGIDFKKFSSEFRVDGTLLTELKRVAYSKNTWNDQMFIQDSIYISYFLKANIAYFLWGNNGLECVMIDTDKPIKKALELIPAATKMVN